MTPFSAGVAVPHSVLARMDPLTKLCAALGTVIAIATFPAHAGWRYPVILLLVCVVALVAAVPMRYLARRCLGATPFIAMAAALPFVSAIEGGADLAVLVAWRAYSAILLLSILAATTSIEDLVDSLRRLGAPRGLALTAILMHRYLSVLLGEWQRIVRARDCRGGVRAAGSRTRLWANQVAMVFVRGWERADRVASGMLARGFRGDFPRPSRHLPSMGEVIVCSALPSAVVLLRVV